MTKRLAPSNGHDLADASSGFFPVLDDFLEYIHVTPEKFDGPRKVLVSLAFLRRLLGIVVGEMAFDEQYYRDRYPDLRRAFESQEIEDLKAHFVNHGFFERRHGSLRQASPVDEKWYLNEYPDVAKGIAEGTVASATAHYMATGRREGRRPAPDIPDAVIALIRAMHPSEEDGSPPS
jgi:hypothetical protein